MTKDQSARFDSINNWLQTMTPFPIERRTKKHCDFEFDFVMACLRGELRFNFENDTIAQVIAAQRAGNLVEKASLQQHGAFHGCALAYLGFLAAWA